MGARIEETVTRQRRMSAWFEPPIAANRENGRECGDDQGRNPESSTWQERGGGSWKFNSTCRRNRRRNPTGHDHSQGLLEPDAKKLRQSETASAAGCAPLSAASIWTQLFAGVVSPRFSVQLQPFIPQLQETSHVQTGVQLQLQLWQAQVDWAEGVALEAMFFMDDCVSSPETEPQSESYSGGKESFFFSSPAARSCNPGMHPWRNRRRIPGASRAARHAPGAA